MRDEYLSKKWNAISLACPAGTAREMLDDLQKRYSKKSRHYHNFDHLAAMFRLFDAHYDQLQDPDIVALAIFFHDAIYKPARKDNEEASAVFAKKMLEKAGMEKGKTDLLQSFILATKNHILPEHAHPDMAFLLDFDLAILGASPGDYDAYALKIRHEYRIYPDILYRPGRCQALEHFLRRPFIFQTPVFRKKFEQQARENLSREIVRLSG